MAEVRVRCGEPISSRNGAAPIVSVVTQDTKTPEFTRLNQRDLFLGDKHTYSPPFRYVVPITRQ